MAEVLARYLVHEECPALHTNRYCCSEIPTSLCCDCGVAVQQVRHTTLTAEALEELRAAIEGTRVSTTTAVSVWMCFHSVNAHVFMRLACLSFKSLKIFQALFQALWVYFMPSIGNGTFGLPLHWCLLPRGWPHCHSQALPDSHEEGHPSEFIVGKDVEYRLGV